MNPYRSTLDSENADFIPGITINRRQTDKTEVYRQNGYNSRYDNISERYYGKPNKTHLIKTANPEYISEYEIPEGASIRIPFPLNEVEKEYQNKTNQRLNQAI